MTSLGGGIQGISPKQTITNYRDSEQVRLRRTVVKSWNTAYAPGTYNNYNRRIGQFRAVANLGDFLSRPNYSCGGANQINSRAGLHGLIIGSIPQNCDSTGVPPSTTNVKWVPDSSDYITFKKQRATNLLYNDKSFGGDDHNGSYVHMMAARNGIGSV